MMPLTNRWVDKELVEVVEDIIKRYKNEHIKRFGFEPSISFARATKLLAAKYKLRHFKALSVEQAKMILNSGGKR